MEDNYIDITVTSPPYNIGRNRRSSRKGKSIDHSYDTIGDNLSKKEYFELTQKWLEELLRVTKHHVFYNIASMKGNKGIENVFNDTFSEYLKETFIWAKKNPQSSVQDKACAKGFEYIYCLSKDSPDTNVFTYCNFSNKAGDYMKNVIIKPTIGNNKETKGHGFAFPDWLPEFFIRNFSKPGDIVYDPFMGTGTTAKAALNLRRIFIGSEVSKKYHDFALKRIEPYVRTHQTKMF